MSKGEDAITAWFAQQSKVSPLRFPIGIGDDMAEIALPGGESFLVTTDILLEGVHFDLREASLEDVGYKAMAVSLSDCAAMATVPAAAVFSVGLPSGFGGEELKKLHAGIVGAGDAFDCALVGGDIAKWKSEHGLVISGTVMSRRMEGKQPVRRSGARVGDKICVTGALGGSRAGKHLHFTPRVKEALRLVELADIHAMMDLSDGLSRDLPRICKASSTGAVVHAEKIPFEIKGSDTFNSDTKKVSDPFNLSAALHDGEDFELLFTLAAADCERLLAAWDCSVPITAIGEIVEGEKVQLRTADGKLQDLQAKGFDHLD